MTWMPSARARAAVAGVALSTLVAGALVLPAAPVAAIGLDCEWTGSGGDGSWSDAANWTGCGGGAPGEGDLLRFGAGAANQAMVNDLGAVRFGEVEFAAAGYALTGDPLTTAGLTVGAPTTLGVELVVSAAPGYNLHHIAADLEILAPHTLSFDQEPLATDIVTLYGGATLTAAIGGSDDESVILRGHGTFEATALGYAGSIDLVGDATLRCGGPGCGAPGGRLLIDETATLEFTGDTVFERDLVLGTGVPLSAYALVTGAHDVELAGHVTVDAIVYVEGGTGGDPLVFSGGITVADDALYVHADAALPAGASLTTGPAGELNVGSIGAPGRFSIADGQPDHAGILGVSGVGSLLIAGDSLALGGPGSGITTIGNGATLTTDGTVILDEDLRLGPESRLATIAPATSLTVRQLKISGVGYVETEVGPASIVLDAAITGDGGLQVTSAGADAPVIFADGAPGNSYTGPTVLETGSVQLDREVSIPGDLVIREAAVTTLHTDAADLHDLIADDATVTFEHAAGSLVINDNERIGALAGAAGVLHLVDDASGLTVAGSSATAFAGDLRGHGVLRHEGPGSLELMGDWTDTATGSELQIAAGLVTVHGTMPETAATVQGELRGTGLLGAVTLDGGTLAAGSSPGCLTVDGDLDGGSGTIVVELGGATPCAGFDQIAAGQLGLLPGIQWEVEVVDGFAPAVGDVFVVVTSPNPSIAHPTKQVSDGPYAFEVVSTGETFELRVTAAPAAGPGTGLAATGAEPLPGLAVGVGALVAGLLLAAGAVVLRRRGRADVRGSGA